MIAISGRAGTTVMTDALGQFSVGGLDTGTYVIEPIALPPNWSTTSPTTGSRRVTLGINDTSNGNDFGSYFPWNIVSGIVYLDRNGNRLRDQDEPGLGGWLVRLGGEKCDSAWTDSTGKYEFNDVVPGQVTLSLAMQPAWEQLTPLLQGGYSEDIQTWAQLYTGGDFGVHAIPRRIRNTLSVRDNTAFAHRDIWWGVRPGTTYGIAGVDAGCKLFDFAEGEFEIPPQTYGLFDARFEDPGGGLPRFGYGSWTDVRDFFGPGQVDKYKVTFQPGYAYGGDYPMTLSWSSDDVLRTYSGPVTMTSTGSQSVDMKKAESCIIADPNVSSVTILAQGPIFPPQFAKAWHLVSLPTPPAKAMMGDLFPTATGHAFAFTPGAGYSFHDSLMTGIGYWIRYSAGVDSILNPAPSRMVDSPAVARGWNLIGALSVPLDVRSIRTIPSNLLGSSFFGYDRGYVAADTLLPARGYWIKAKETGSLILSALGGGVAKGGDAEGPVRTMSDGASRLIFTNAGGEERELFVLPGDQQEPDPGMLDLPPLPPEGGFDARFASNRALEIVRGGETKEFPVALTTDEYPVTVRWQTQSDGGTRGLSVLVASIRNGAEMIPIQNGAILRLANAPKDFSVVISRVRNLPSTFTLNQNFPNPFNPTTLIRYGIPRKARVSMTIFDLLGKEVAVLLDDVREAGYYEVQWNGTNALRTPVASGIYLCRMVTTETSETHVQTKKMIMMK
jgi:hypothetical protein